MRLLVLIHRYLGIAIGILMAVWCLSGVVMMYVGYPALTRAARLQALAPVDLRGCCPAGISGLTDVDRVASFELEMLASDPVLRVRFADGSQKVLDLASGRALSRVSAAQALSVARNYAVSATKPTGGSAYLQAPPANIPGSSANLPAPPVADLRARPVDSGTTSMAIPTPTLAGMIDYDQWTLEGVAKRERPLYRIALNDAKGTTLYVSSISGRAVQIVSERERFWNWVGAVPHWLYFARLRNNARLWSQLVIWTSLLGCLLTATGLYLGVQRFARRPRGRWSPFRGILLWHHLPSLLFGLFALTWVASGLISMNPWGFLDSAGFEPVATDFSGAQVKESIGALAGGAAAGTTLAGDSRVSGGRALSAGDNSRISSALSADDRSRTRRPLPANLVSVTSAPFGGKLYLIVAGRDGSRLRLDAGGTPAPLSPADITRFAETLGAVSTPELITSEDAYYFTHHREVAALPVYRSILGDLQRTRLCIDPVSGAIVSALDSNSRWYRWLHEGLHRMDFTPGLRTRPVWDLVMLFLLCGVATVCGTGAVLGIRRLVFLK